MLKTSNLFIRFHLQGHNRPFFNHLTWCHQFSRSFWPIGWLAGSETSCCEEFQSHEQLSYLKIFHWKSVKEKVSTLLSKVGCNLPYSPGLKQFTPKAGFLSATCWDFISVRVPIGSRPLFSASASGMDSKASAKALNAYCSMVLI